MVKNLPANEGDSGNMSMKGTQETWVWFLGLGRFPGEGNGNQLQYPCLENPMDRGTWWGTVHGVVKSDMTEQLSAYTHTHLITPPKDFGLPWWLRWVKNVPAMEETQVWSLGLEDPLEKGMVTHSSILAWRIPWTEEPGRIQSMGLQRVGHDWATNTFTFPKTLGFQGWTV